MNNRDFSILFRSIKDNFETKKKAPNGANVYYILKSKNWPLANKKSKFTVSPEQKRGQWTRCYLILILILILISMNPVSFNAENR